MSIGVLFREVFEWLTSKIQKTVHLLIEDLLQLKESLVVKEV